MNKQDDDLLKRALIISDIGYYGNRTPHARTLRRLLKEWDLPSSVRSMLLRIVRKPVNAAVKIIRFAIQLEGEEPYEIKREGHPHARH